MTLLGFGATGTLAGAQPDSQLLTIAMCSQ